MKLENPIEKTFLSLFTSTMVIIISIAFLGHFIFDLSIVIFIPLILIIGVFLSFTVHREIFLRPMSVSLFDDGVMLEMRYSNPIFINWNDVLGVGYDHIDWYKNPENKNGTLIPLIGNRYWITYAIAHGIAVKYFSLKGKELPVMYIFEHTEDFRSRIQ